MPNTRSTVTVCTSSTFERALHGYKGHQFQSRKQVFRRALKRVDRQGFQERGRKFTVPGFTVEGNVIESGHRSVRGAARWQNQRCFKVGGWFGSRTSKEKVGERTMQMIRVSSSAISAVGYDPLSRRMKITFVQGHTYDFCGVPQHVFDGLVRASSKGGYYNDHIKDRYQC